MSNNLLDKGKDHDPTKSWVIVGNGFIAKKHKEAIYQIGHKLLAVCDYDKEKSSLEAPLFLNWKDMMDSAYFRDSIDNVAICTPSFLHYKMARDFARAGKRVLCEKPLTLSSREAEILPANIFTVLQLRHHPKVKELKTRDFSKVKKVEMRIVVKRDEEYWNSWKGKELYSGGILFNIGIHYFDLLIYLFGENYEITYCECSKEAAEGKIVFDKRIEVQFLLLIQKLEEGQKRELAIENESINFSSKNNLAEENLHIKVYQDFIENKGITPVEAAKSIKLVEKLWETSQL